MKTLCLIIVLVGAGSFVGMYFHLAGQIQDLKQQNNVLNVEVQERNRQINALDAQIQPLNQQISTLTAELISSNQQASTLKAENKEQEATINSLKATLEALKDDANALSDTLNWVKAENTRMAIKLANSFEIRQTSGPANELVSNEAPLDTHSLDKVLFSPLLKVILSFVFAPFVIAFGVGLKEKILRGKYRRF